MNPAGQKASEWWLDFFEGAFGEMQVAGVFEDKAIKEVDFIEKVLGLTPGCEILDVPCGPGRHSVELASRGCKVTGVDFNGNVLEHAAKAANGRGVTVDLLRQDMRALQFGDRFDAAVCFWGSFGYFDDIGDRAFAAGAFRALKPGGRFLVETHTVETLAKIFQARGWDWWDDGENRHRVLQERVWNLESSRVDAKWTFVRDGSERSWETSVRLYTYRELCGLLLEVGFKDFAGFDTLSGEPFSAGSRRLTLVATK